jgi:two-component system, cell cycle response regulator DivK
MAKTVLLVEDNPDERMLYTTLLEHYGYRVLAAGTAEEGVWLARTKRPDLILMDVHLPDGNGLDAAKRIRTIPESAEIPIVATTVHKVPRGQALEAGCEGYLPKPFVPKQLLAAVESLIGSPDDGEP